MPQASSNDCIANMCTETGVRVPTFLCSGMQVPHHKVGPESVSHKAYKHEPPTEGMSCCLTMGHLIGACVMARRPMLQGQKANSGRQHPSTNKEQATRMAIRVVCCPDHRVKTGRPTLYLAGRLTPKNWQAAFPRPAGQWDVS